MASSSVFNNPHGGGNGGHPAAPTAVTEIVWSETPTEKSGPGTFT